MPTILQVRSSGALRVVMQQTLALGNYLNGGTNKGGAYGFRLDSLNKLGGTKTVDNKSTLLHYIARVLSAGGPREAPTALQLGKEMPHVEAAARIVWKEEVSEISSFGSSLAQASASS